jgi:hypothetical protein
METVLRGKEELEKCITEIVEPFGLTAKLGTDFAYYYAWDLVTFSVFHTEGFETFLLDAESRFPMNYGVHPFMWCLFHEIGHHETGDDLTEEEVATSVHIKEECIYDDEDPYANMLYYTCPDEYAATDWAGRYIAAHKDKINDLWNKILVALAEFYAVNNITED